MNWWRRIFGGGPAPLYIRTMVTNAQWIHDSCIVEPPFKEAEFIDFSYELWRDLYHCIWVIR